MNTRLILTTTVLLTGLQWSSFAAANPAESAIDSCMTAVTADAVEVIDGNVARVKPRGGSWEVWLNVNSSDADLKVWCLAKRGVVRELVAQEGTWMGRNIKRPAADVRVAQNRAAGQDG